MTNGDRIRSELTDEEIAEWVLRLTICPCDAIRKGCTFDDNTCRQAWLEYLKEESNT